MYNLPWVALMGEGGGYNTTSTCITVPFPSLQAHTKGSHYLYLVSLETAVHNGVNKVVDRSLVQYDSDRAPKLVGCPLAVIVTLQVT